MFDNVFIVSATRTAIGNFGGSLKDVSAIDLGVIVAKEAMHRAGINSDAIDEVIFGNVGQYGLNAFLARLVSLNAGIPCAASAQTVNRMCASGLQAVVTGALLLEHGDADTVLVGGSENMSQYPYYLPYARWGMRMGVQGDSLLDALTVALCEPTTGVDQHVAITAENIARRYGLTREQLDAYALDTQGRALRAIAEGKFTEEITPIEVRAGKQTVVFDTDEHPRETTMEQLARLKPILGSDTLITAGNASGIDDAAAAMVLMTGEAMRKYGCKPLARLVDFACAGLDPMVMGLGPVEATRKLFGKTGLSKDDLDVTELNEAFAAQAMACIHELELDPALVNPNGSGIALGHPLGATGAIITVKLLYEMKQRNVRYGLATLCIGGGQGMSAVFERMGA
ncbi:MAG: thiolase family protein [Eubacteriales bacterium]|nr:thiolase family protein [Eubacteriales bacterium]